MKPETLAGLQRAVDAAKPPLWTPETGLTRTSYMDLIGGISIRHEGDVSSVAYSAPMFALDPTYLMDHEFMAARASWLDVRGDGDLIIACGTHHYRRIDDQVLRDGEQGDRMACVIAEAWIDHNGGEWWLYCLDDVDHDARPPGVPRVTLG